MFSLYMRKFKAAEKTLKNINKKTNVKANLTWYNKKISIFYISFIFLVSLFSGNLLEDCLFGAFLLFVFFSTNTLAKMYYCFLLFALKKSIWRLYLKGKIQESFSYYRFLNSNSFFLFNVNSVYRIASLFNIVIVSSVIQFLGKPLNLWSYMTIGFMLTILLLSIILSIKTIKNMILEDFYDPIINSHLHTDKQKELKWQQFQSYIAKKEKMSLKNADIVIEKEKSENLPKTNRL